MKTRLATMKRILISLFVLTLSSFAGAAELDDLLVAIKADIAAQRLNSPAGNNALERIQKFREKAPYDFRITPLAYAWGEANVRLANNAIDAKDFSKAQEYLDRVWQVASLTNGLEDAQAKLDKLSDGQTLSVAAPKPNKEELERQKKLAEAAEKEKERVAADIKRKKEEDAKRLAADKAKAEQEKQRQQEAERQRRAELEKPAAKPQEPVKAAASTKPAAAPATKAAAAPAAVVKAAVAVATVAAPVVKAPEVAAKAEPAVVPAAAKKPSEDAPENWKDIEEKSAPIATYPLPAAMIDKKDADIVNTLEPICQAIVKNDASVVVHTVEQSDYRWLTVRLTLCLRRIDKGFRLRHSHQAAAQDGKPFISLHPPRDVSLLKENTSE